METSEAINELAGALAKAQGEIKGATKDATNPHFGSKYATLDAVWEACRVALSSNGLSVVQAASTQAETITVTTLLMHTSGQWIKEALALYPKDASPQAAGSALTYARRYGLSSMVGVAPEDDDDANAAQAQMPPRYQDKRFKGPKEGPPLSKDPAVIQAEEDKIFGKPNGAAPAALVAELPQELQNDRFALEMAIARLSEKHKFSMGEKLALGVVYLQKKKVVDAAPLDLVKLYLFMNDAQAVAGWREEQAAR